MDTEVGLLLNLDVEVGHVSGKDESVDTERERSYFFNQK